MAANQSTVHSLRLQVDQGQDIEKWKYGQDTHVLCGALKVILLELNPIFRQIFRLQPPRVTITIRLLIGLRTINDVPIVVSVWQDVSVAGYFLPKILLQYLFSWDIF